MGFGYYIMSQQRGRPVNRSPWKNYENKSVKKMLAELVGITSW